MDLVRPKYESPHSVFGQETGREPFRSCNLAQREEREGSVFQPPKRRNDSDPLRVTGHSHHDQVWKRKQESPGVGPREKTVTYLSPSSLWSKSSSGALHSRSEDKERDPYVQQTSEEVLNIDSEYGKKFSFSHLPSKSLLLKNKILVKKK